MRTFVRLLALFGCGVLAFAFWVVVFIVYGQLDEDWVVPDWLGVVALVSPFVGAGIGGWLVSRQSSRRGKIGWIVGGGLGMGFVAFVGAVYLIAWIVLGAMEDIYGNGGYCC